MTEREIIVIPAKIGNLKSNIGNMRLRVASYSRVSTDFEEQLSSFYAQKAYYTDLIMRKPEWTLAGTYADEGLSGASAEKRPDFMKMIRDCKRGKIDLIITKSISRFARNTLDSISYVRMLKAMGIGVMFEKENINTLEENSEVVLTILASLAQEELNSLSLNVKMGKRMAMQEGKVSFQYKKMYAYRKGADGQPEIILEEAEIIKRIFTGCLIGKSIRKIAEELNAENIPSPYKRQLWTDATIRSILTNERYCGDVILQKTYVTDPISKKVKKNNGELPKIYIKNNHMAIISRELFDKVQQELSRRSSKRKVSKNTITEQGKYSSIYALTEILICGNCNTPYRRVIWTKRNGEKQVVWRCISRLDYGPKYCKDSATIDEESLKNAIVQAINASRGSRQELISVLTSNLRLSMYEKADNSFNVEQVEQHIADLKAATMALITESIGNNSVGQNEEKLKAMSDEIKELHDALIAYRESANSTNSIDNRIDEITEALENETPSDEYDDNLVRQLISTIKVMGTDKIIIYFKCGLEYEQSINSKVKKINRVA